MTAEGRPESRHFRLQDLGSGVFAAIATEDGWAVGNAGFVDLGDHVVVFDTFSNHLAAQDLKAAAEAVTGKHADIVVNSHPHRDHVKGNQVFDDAAIVATRATTETMTRNWKARTARVDKEGLDPIRSDLTKEFDAWESHPVTDDRDRVLWEGYRQSLLQGIEDYRLRLPTVSFETSLRIHGSRATAEALTFGGGHSVSDAILFVPESRVAFLGDLLFIGIQPFFGDGDLEEYLRILDRIEALDPKALVPGHGPVGTIKDLQPMRDYVLVLQRTTADAIAAGRDPKEAAREPIPPPFQSMGWRAFWPENVEFFVRKGAAPAEP